MRTLVAVVTLVVVCGNADAQPGQTPAPAPYPYPYPPPPSGYQPGYGYPVPLTQEEHELLLEGEISDGQIVGGGLAELFIGFGLGQALQGRWSETGWIFTLGEAASTIAFSAGIVRTFEDCFDTFGNEQSCNNGDGVPLMIAGMIGLSVFRVWGTIDAFGGPSEHNRRLRDLKFRMGVPVRVGLKPYVNRTRNGGATAGLTLSF